MTEAADDTTRGGIMAGAGVYRDASQTQHGAAESGFALIGPAIDDAAIGRNGPPMVLADFGAAQGNNSLEPIRRALDAVRAQAPTRAAYVVHTDIVGNDFTTLAAVLESSPQRYDRGNERVLPLMAARSLYDRVFPAGQLVFGWTASTLHWLRRAPCSIPDHFFVQLSRDEEARSSFAAQSARDWRDFIGARAAELAPGASVVIVDVLMGDDGVMGSEALFERLNDALALCHTNGLLSGEEAARIVYPTWFRSLPDLRRPFTPEFVGAGGERLELVDVVPVREDDPFRDQLDDPQTYAASQVAFLQGFLEPSFAAALDQGRSAEERAQVLEAVWSRARELIAGDARAVSPSYRLIALRIRRC